MSSRMLVGVVFIAVVLFVVVRCDVRHAASGAPVPVQLLPPIPSPNSPPKLGGPSPCPPASKDRPAFPPHGRLLPSGRSLGRTTSP